MKLKLFIFAILFIASTHVFSQDESIDTKKEEKTSGFFYKISLATTLKINEDWTIETDDDETFLEPSALFVNNTIGYQFDSRSLIGLNFEYDWHSEQGLHFFPAYIGYQYNILDFDDKLFIRGGYGTLLGMGKSFEKGNMYKFGIGVQLYDKNFRNSFLLGLDFTRKRFGYRTLEGLSSVSIFIEFMIF